MTIEISGETAKTAYNQILITETIHVAVELIAHHKLQIVNYHMLDAV
jgi:hypothetical protein